MSSRCNETYNRCSRRLQHIDVLRPTLRRTDLCYSFPTGFRDAVNRQPLDDAPFALPLFRRRSQVLKQLEQIRPSRCPQGTCQSLIGICHGTSSVIGKPPLLREQSFRSTSKE